VPSKITARKKIIGVSLIAAVGIIFFLVTAFNPRVPVIDPADVAHLPAARIALDGVPNAGQVTPTLFRGAQPTPEGFHSLALRGTEIVVDLRDEGNRQAEKESVTQNGMKYIGIPWSCQAPSDSVTAQFLQAIRENTDKKIFVHCQHGIDRTGLMIAAYRMADQGWTPEQARHEMEAYGFDYAHRSWCGAVDSYETSFPQRYSTSPEFESLRAPAQKSLPQK
jgi:tyrosine-protein phosphatase SIW14